MESRTWKVRVTVDTVTCMKSGSEEDSVRMSFNSLERIVKDEEFERFALLEARWGVRHEIKDRILGKQSLQRPDWMDNCGDSWEECIYNLPDRVVFVKIRSIRAERCYGVG